MRVKRNYAREVRSDLFMFVKTEAVGKKKSLQGKLNFVRHVNPKQARALQTYERNQILAGEPKICPDCENHGNKLKVSWFKKLSARSEQPPLGSKNAFNLLPLKRCEPFPTRYGHSVNSDLHCVDRCRFFVCWRCM
jgi:hypothetical protein